MDEEVFDSVVRAIIRSTRGAGFNGAPYTRPDGERVNVAEEFVRALLSPVRKWFLETGFKGEVIGNNLSDTSSAVFVASNKPEYYVQKYYGITGFPPTAGARKFFRALIDALTSELGNTYIEVSENAKNFIAAVTKEGTAKGLLVELSATAEVPSISEIQKTIIQDLEERLPGTEHTKYRAAVVKAVSNLVLELLGDIKTYPLEISTGVIQGTSPNDSIPITSITEFTIYRG